MDKSLDITVWSVLHMSKNSIWSTLINCLLREYLFRHEFFTHPTAPLKLKYYEKIIDNTRNYSRFDNRMYDRKDIRNGHVDESAGRSE